MHITERFLAFTLLGAEWVLWLLVILSVLSVAIMLERAWFFGKHHFDAGALATELRKLLGTGNIAAARKRLEGRDTVEEVVVRTDLDELDRGANAVAEAMAGAKATERLRLERNLAFLGTLGSSAPFIGLFGTVLGVVKGLHDLSTSHAGDIGPVVGALSEALVATAVGLLVAIPALVAYNYFGRRVRSTVANVDMLAHQVLVQLHSLNAEAAPGQKAKGSN